MRYTDYLLIANRDGKPTHERVQPWKWEWTAIYHDGSMLSQHADDENTQDDKGNFYKGKFHQISEIDQSKLDIFLFTNRETKVKHALKFNAEEMKLICYYQKGRQFVYTNEQQGEGFYQYYVLHCFGYEKNIGGKTHKTIFKILPDDNIVITDDPELMIEFK